jgi:DNA-binding Lrp family transcriptional regulator
MSLPLKVTEAYDKLKREYPFYVALKKINGKYYLYKQTSHADENKKVKVITEYLGRVKDDGVFIKKVISKDTELENAKTLILARGGKVILPERNEEGVYIPTKKTLLDEIEGRLLTVLSTNARASLSFLGKQIGLTPSTTYSKISNLENKYGIKYIAEIDIEKFGYLRFFIMVKFLDDIPNIPDLKETLSKDPRVQLAFLIKGDYDLVIYALAKNINTEETLDIMVSLKSGILSKYRSKWYTVPFYEHFSFVPLRTEFIDSIGKSLLKREYAVLKELNIDGSADFSKIDKKYGFDNGRARYTYYKLKEAGKIKRITISLHKLPIKYIGMIFKEFIDQNQFMKNRSLSLLDIIKETGLPINRYVLTGDIGNPGASLIFMPVFKDDDLINAVEDLKKLDLGVELKTAIITTQLVGSFCYRRIDYAYSKQYDILVEKYHYNLPDKINYEESGRKIKPERLTKTERNLIED